MSMAFLVRLNELERRIAALEQALDKVLARKDEECRQKLEQKRK